MRVIARVCTRVRACVSPSFVQAILPQRGVLTRLDSAFVCLSSRPYSGRWRFAHKSRSWSPSRAPLQADELWMTYARCGGRDGAPLATLGPDPHSLASPRVADLLQVRIWAEAGGERVEGAADLPFRKRGFKRPGIRLAHRR